MRDKCAYLVSLILLSLSFGVSLLLFQSGFLLKRHEVRSRSECSDVSVTHGSCWLPARYQRVVVLLVDALRYDFAAPSTDHEKAFAGRLPIIGKLLAEQNESAVLTHFYADPPTTTMQRLKGLTTGSLPTFIDVGSNFASSAVVEDNWVDQIARSHRNLTFLGDDTWVALYPTQFHRSRHMPSFDINDINGVDDLILKHIYDELHRDDWSVLIAHFLGVDHCGHKYGPSHPEMSRKLSQMDAVIENVTELLDDDTLLVVMGDHGMTTTGDHGGDTHLETDAALFMYSRKKLLHSSPPAVVSQVDLVPTLSLLLDSPIPFSNIGVLMECVIPREMLPLAVSSNAWQMARYAHTMAADIAGVEPILRRFDSEPETVASNRDTMAHLQSLFRSSWTNFNTAFMRVGSLSLLDAFLTCLGAAFGACDVSPGWLVFRSGLLFVQASTYLLGDEDYYVPVLDALLSFSLLLRAVRIPYWILSLRVMCSHLLLLTILGVHALSFFSNSFVVFEAASVRLLAQTAFVIAVFRSPFIRKAVGRRRWGNANRRFDWRRILAAAGVVILFRVGSLFERCREEQQFSCFSTMFSLPLTRLPYGLDKTFRFLFGVLVLCGMCFGFATMTKRFASDLLTSCLLFPSAVATVSSWLAQFLPEKAAENFAIFSLVSSQIVYVLSGVSICLLLFRSSRGKTASFPRGCAISYLAAVCSSLSLLLGDGLSPSFAALILIVFGSSQLILDELHLMVVYSLLSSHGFFALSHDATFAGIPWHAAFIGVRGNFHAAWVPGVLVVAHTFASHVLVSAALPVSIAEQSACAHRPALLIDLPRRSMLFLFLQSWKVLAVCAAAVVHRRHLMVWKIFAPKFIFESLAFLVVCFSLIVTNCALRNVSFLKAK